MAREAYHFVREALDYTQKKIHKDARNRKSRLDRSRDRPATCRRHPDYGLALFGPMTCSS